MEREGAGQVIKGKEEEALWWWWCGHAMCVLPYEEDDKEAWW